MLGRTESEREGMEKGIPCKWKLKTGVAILISDKIDFKTKSVIRQRWVLYNKGINPTGGCNIYEYLYTNMRALKYVKGNY